MSDAISLLSKNSEQQKDSIKNDTHRKKSLDRIEMMKFLENIIQEEDQYRYQQSFENENTSAIDFNLSQRALDPPQRHSTTTDGASADPTPSLDQPYCRRKQH